MQTDQRRGKVAYQEYTDSTRQQLRISLVLAAAFVMSALGTGSQILLPGI